MTRVQLAARNNAHLYQRVCAAHNCRTVIDNNLLLCLDTPPRFYGQAVTLSEHVNDIVAERVTGAFKDSFHDIEPDPTLYQILFTADWIWHENANRNASTAIEWALVTTDIDLAEWGAGWADGDNDAPNFPRQFPTELLSCDDMKFYSARKGSRMVGGALINITGSVVGISNVFQLGISENELWNGIVALIKGEFPDYAATGYERDESLQAAIDSGFKSIGKLRVWIPNA